MQMSRIAVMPVPMEEASRFGIVITDDNNKITEFEEKPEHPKKQSGFHGYLHLQLEGAKGSTDLALERSEQLRFWKTCHPVLP